MFRKLIILLISVSLCLTTIACSSPRSTSNQPNQSNNVSLTSTQLQEGQYPVQQATYDDVTGEYTLMLLNTPPGTPSVFRTTDLQMARLSDEEISAGKKPYLQVNGNQTVLHLTEDFRIEYVHNVTETQNNPQTGQSETVVVRRETSFWTPFAGALAGQLVGNMLFTPRYYVPPVYQPGGTLTGYGGYGNTYNQAVDRYQSRYQAPPPAVRNRQTFRTTGRLRNTTTSNQPTTTTSRSPSSNRATGSGYGSSTLRQSNQSTPRRVNRPSSFGSGSRRMSRPGRRR